MEYRRIDDSVRAEAPGSFVRLSKGFTHYEIAGPKNGTVVLFVHGFSVPYYMWDRTFYAVAKAGFRVVRFDLYGRGLSDRPLVKYNRKLFIEQIEELLGALHIEEPIDIVGTSMGGAVTTAFSAEHPDRVHKIVLIDPLSAKWKIGPLAIPGIGEYLFTWFHLPSSPIKQLGDFCHPELFPEWPVRFREQMQFKGFGRAILSTLRHFMNRDHLNDYQRLGWLRKKVLLIWGDLDRTLGTEEAPTLQSILGADLQWVKDSGHVPHYEHAEIVNSRIISFLEKEQFFRDEEPRFSLIVNRKNFLPINHTNPINNYEIKHKMIE
jgi:pimeloyl-ACP methyl ester carboxylesterase